jgi:hypothetical protein
MGDRSILSQPSKPGDPRALPRRFAPLVIFVVLVALILGACGGAQSLVDPREIITKGLAATADLTSLHVSATVSGSFIEPTSGATIGLDGTTLKGDVATSGQGHFTFAVPTFLGLSGDLIISGTNLYYKTTLTGPKWGHQQIPVPSPGASGSASAAASLDPKAAALVEIGKLLLKDGVVSKKLDDVACGDAQCYHVQVSVPSSVMDQSSDMSSLKPSDIFGGALVVDLLFDREHLWLTELSTKIDSAKAGTFSAKLTFSAFNVPVTVSPPPSDQVQEGDLTLP